MPTLKAIRKRIASVRSTQQITKAMKMVSAAKLRRAQEAATSARPYAQKLEELLRSAAASAGDAVHALLRVPPREERVHLVLVTADRGLCGAYNANLIRAAENFLAERGRENVRLTIVGRRGCDYFKKRAVSIAGKHVNLFAGPGRDLAEALGSQLADEFRRGEVHGVYLLYSHFRSTLSQVPTVVRLLPIEAAIAEGEPAAEYLCEPGAAAVLDRLLSRYATVLVHRAFLEAVASEHAARMTAMDSATNNAAEMIARLTLAMNRARQAAITKELMEIVSGAEALRG